MPLLNWIGEQKLEIVADISLLALARAAETLQLCRPIMTDQPILEIKDGRHPLQELCVAQQYISNDTVMEAGSGGERSSMVSTHRLCS